MQRLRACKIYRRDRRMRCAPGPGAMHLPNGWTPQPRLPCRKNGASLGSDYRQEKQEGGLVSLFKDVAHARPAARPGAAHEQSI